MYGLTEKGGASWDDSEEASESTYLSSGKNSISKKFSKVILFIIGMFLISTLVVGTLLFRINSQVDILVNSGILYAGITEAALQTETKLSVLA